MLSGCSAPEPAHALSRVTSPAFNESMGREVIAVDLLEFGFMEPDLGPAVDFVAVVEHEATFIGVPEVFEVRNLYLITGFASVEIVNEFLLGAEKYKVCVVFLLHGTEVGQEVALFLTRSSANI